MNCVGLHLLSWMGVRWLQLCLVISLSSLSFIQISFLLYVKGLCFFSTSLLRSFFHILVIVLIELTCALLSRPRSLLRVSLPHVPKSSFVGCLFTVFHFFWILTWFWISSAAFVIFPVKNLCCCCCLPARLHCLVFSSCFLLLELFLTVFWTLPTHRAALFVPTN